MTQLQQSAGGRLQPREGKSFKAALMLMSGTRKAVVVHNVTEPKQTELELERNSFDPNFNP